MTFLIIIVSALFISTVTSLGVLKKKGNKWSGIIVAFLINVLVLSLAAVILYKINVQVFHKGTSGVFGSLGIVVLVFFIPINTFINYCIIEFVRRKSVVVHH